MRRSLVVAAALLIALPAAGPLARSGELRAQTPFEVHEAGIGEIGAALDAGRTTSVALVDAYLARIRAYDQPDVGLNAVVRLNPRARSSWA